ncbi:MAG: hypothetical protein KDK48_01165 [Chlamydiia bacterium]|nr:hypothetical protein [Chlamydiia bacterium]
MSFTLRPEEFPSITPAANQRLRWKDPEGLTKPQRSQFNTEMRALTKRYFEEHGVHPGADELESLTVSVLGKIKGTATGAAVAKTEAVAAEALPSPTPEAAEVLPLAAALLAQKLEVGKHTDMVPVLRSVLRTLQVAAKDADDRDNPAHTLLAETHAMFDRVIDALTAAFRTRNELLVCGAVLGTRLGYGENLSKPELLAAFVKPPKSEEELQKLLDDAKALSERLKEATKEVPEELSEEAIRALETTSKQTSSQKEGEIVPVKERVDKLKQNAALIDQSFYVTASASALLTVLIVKLEHRLGEVKAQREKLSIPESVEAPKERVLTTNDQLSTIESAQRLLSEAGDTKEMLEDFVAALNALATPKGKYNSAFVASSLKAFETEFAWLKERQEDLFTKIDASVATLKKVLAEENPLSIPEKDRSKLEKGGGTKEIDEAANLSRERKAVALTQIRILEALKGQIEDRLFKKLTDKSALAYFGSYLIDIDSRGSLGIEPLLAKLKEAGARIEKA